MTDATTLVLKRSEPIDFIVADGTAIEKGAICMISGPRTAATNTGTGDIIAGIARREKIATDGRTRLSIFTGPGDIFRMTAAAGPTIAAGSLVATSGPNLIRLATSAEHILGKVIGKTLEEITSEGTGEVMLCQ